MMKMMTLIMITNKKMMLVVKMTMRLTSATRVVTKIAIAMRATT